MKTVSERADVVIVGGGLAGLCAAVAAARSGAIVKLVESNHFLGGRIGSETRFPLDHEGGSSFVYQREAGLLDELLMNLLAENHEGTYAGQNRAIFNWVARQERLELFLGSQISEAVLSPKGDKIEALSSVSERKGCRIHFKARYFIDCTGIGAIAQLAKAPGERGTDLTEYAGDGVPELRLATCMRIADCGEEVTFQVPDWVRLRWEDNHLSARIDLLESLDERLLGDHNVEWISPVFQDRSPSSEEIVWSAWDFLKNRSPLAGRAASLMVEDFSTMALRQDNFRARGDFTLDPADMEKGRTYSDSVAVGRSPMDLGDALLSSVRGKVALPHPFEIPLRCLYSQKVKNLFLAGGHASCTSRASASLRHPPTSAQMGAAAGLSSALCIKKKRLPRTLAKSGYVDELRKLLYRTNHATGTEPYHDTENLLTDANVTASSTLDRFSLSEPGEGLKTALSSGLIQFPVSTSEIQGVKVYLEAKSDSILRCGLYASPSLAATCPGPCLDRAEFSLEKGFEGWVDVPVAAQVGEPGWHFLEISSEGSVFLHEQENAPVGMLFHRAERGSQALLRNPYSEYAPVTSSLPGPSRAPCIEVLPRQSVYAPSNLVDAWSRPGRLPHLWISQPTDFRYPEFIEFHWDEPRRISCLDLVFDASPEFLFPSRPKRFEGRSISSLVRSYRFFHMDEVGHWQELLDVADNGLGFRSHEFPAVETRGLELEIRSTHGIDRAQVYQVRAYS